MAHNILIVEDNLAAASWLNDRLELGLGDVEVRIAYTDEDALDQLEETRFDLMFLTYELVGSEKNGLKLINHIKRNSAIYRTPRAVWVHTKNMLGGQVMMASLEDLLVPCCRRPLDWCKANPTPFIEIIQDILISLPKDRQENMPRMLLH